jgi:drug/metabolite transporter (DMT)-like permease
LGTAPVVEALSAVTDPQPAPRAPLAVHVVLLLTQVAFGSLAVEGKLVMGPRFGVSPTALAMIRIFGGAIVFVPALVVAKSRAPVRSPRHVAELAVLALLGIVINQALFLAGLRQTSPVAATLLVGTIPVFAAVIGAASGREPLTLRRVAGTAVALVGVGVLTGFALPRRGDTLVLINAASYAAYLVFSKAALARHGTLGVLAWVFGVGALLFSPIGAGTLVHEATLWAAPTACLVAFIVLVPTAFAYSANAWALARATPGLVTVYVYLQPLIVAVLAWAQLGQAPERRALVAGPIILAGVALVVTAPRQLACATTQSRR